MTTICSVIEQLYMEAVASGNECMQHDLRLVYHMAKKMNRKLIKYKTGMEETWTEVDGDKRLEEIKQGVLTCINKRV